MIFKCKLEKFKTLRAKHVTRDANRATTIPFKKNWIFNPLTWDLSHPIHFHPIQFRLKLNYTYILLSFRNHYNKKTQSIFYLHGDRVTCKIACHMNQLQHVDGPGCVEIKYSFPFHTRTVSYTIKNILDQVKVNTHFRVNKSSSTTKRKHFNHTKSK